MRNIKLLKNLVSVEICILIFEDINFPVALVFYSCGRKNRDGFRHLVKLEFSPDRMGFRQDLGRFHKEQQYNE